MMSILGISRWARLPLMITLMARTTARKNMKVSDGESHLLAEATSHRLTMAG
jgi:hypothetical protein